MSTAQTTTKPPTIKQWVAFMALRAPMPFKLRTSDRVVLGVFQACDIVLMLNMVH